jgi:hypothetical protein
VTLRVSFRFDGLAVVNVTQRAFHLLISALNITMSQRKSVLYVSNITTGRSFSALRRLKTYLRTTMLQDRLTSLAVLHVHRDIDIDIDMRSFTLLHAPFDSQSVHIAILSTCFKCYFFIFVIQIWQYKIIQNDESNEFLL